MTLLWVCDRKISEPKRWSRLVRKTHKLSRHVHLHAHIALLFLRSQYNFSLTLLAPPMPHPPVRPPRVCHVSPATQVCLNCLSPTTAAPRLTTTPSALRRASGPRSTPPSLPPATNALNPPRSQSPTTPPRAQAAASLRRRCHRRRQRTTTPCQCRSPRGGTV